MVQIACVTGVYGISFVIATANTTLAASGARGLPRDVAGGLALAAALVLAMLACGRGVLPSSAEEVSKGDAVGVAAVQGHVDLGSTWRSEFYERSLDIYLELTREAIRDGWPAVVFWPEAALSFFLEEDPGYRDVIARLAVAGNTKLVIGGPSVESAAPGELVPHNSIFLVDAQGHIAGRYDKRYLVPFSEYFPLRWLDFVTAALRAGAGLRARLSDRTARDTCGALSQIFLRSPRPYLGGEPFHSVRQEQKLGISVKIFWKGLLQRPTDPEVRLPGSRPNELRKHRAVTNPPGTRQVMTQKSTPRTPLRLRYRLARVSWRDLAVVVGPILLVTIAAFAVAYHYLQPAPPTTLVMTAGTEGSAFRNNAEKYKKILARNGVTLEIMPSRGSVENLARLSDPNTRIDVGFVQGGLPTDLRSDDLVSLGSVFFEPLFVLYRSPTLIERLSQLAGRKLAVGIEGSGSHALALALLKENGIEPGGSTSLLPIAGDAALQAMRERRVDAVFVAGDSAQPNAIRQLLHTPGVRLFDFVQADAYVRRLRFLSRIDLPMGAFDLGQNLPDRPLTLIAPTVDLVARPNLHPALSDLLIEAAQEVGSHGSLLQRPGQFPSPLEHDFPISDDAARYYKSGKSAAYRHLPFWVASLVDRVLVLLLPIVVLVVPGVRAVPALYRWRIRTRIYRRYGHLMALERESLQLDDPEQARQVLERLDVIERTVIDLKLPASFADEAYVLRQHIDFVRARLASVAARRTRLNSTP